MALPFSLLLSFVGDLEQGNLGNISNFPTFLSEGKRLLACFFFKKYFSLTVGCEWKRWSGNNGNLSFLVYFFTFCGKETTPDAFQQFVCPNRRGEECLVVLRRCWKKKRGRGGKSVAAVVGTKASGIPYVAENEKKYPLLVQGKRRGQD